MTPEKICPGNVTLLQILCRNAKDPYRGIISLSSRVVGVVCQGLDSCSATNAAWQDDVVLILPFPALGHLFFMSGRMLVAVVEPRPCAPARQCLNLHRAAAFCQSAQTNMRFQICRQSWHCLLCPRGEEMIADAVNVNTFFLMITRSCRHMRHPCRLPRPPAHHPIPGDFLGRRRFCRHRPSAGRLRPSDGFPPVQCPWRSP